MRIRVVALLTATTLAGSVGLAIGAPPTVPPPTPVPPSGSPSPFPTVLETPNDAARTPELTAASAVLFDLDTGQMLFARKPRAPRPVASLTKIMTAILVLEAAAPGERVTASAAAASQSGAELGLTPGERARVEDLLHALLLGSANDAAVALAENLSGSVAAFVRRMNRRAERLGADDTRFASPNGLDDSGYSTAADIAAITTRAYRDPTFRRIVATRFHRIPAPSGPDRRIQNRNALLWLYPGALGIKTGYTLAARYCLVAAAEQDGLRLGAVVLGAPADAFSDAAALLNHGFDRFERRAVVEDGADLDPVRVEGVDVDVEAAREVELVVDRSADVELVVRPLAGAALPIDEGERVAFVRALVDGDVVARAPAVATSDVGLAGSAGGGSSWWDGLAGFLVMVVRALFG